MAVGAGRSADIRGITGGEGGDGGAGGTGGAGGADDVCCGLVVGKPDCCPGK